MTTILYYQKKLLTSIYIIVKKDIINILNTKIIRDNKIRLDWWTNNNKKNGN